MQDLNEAVKLLTEVKRIMLVGSPKMTYDELASLVTLKLLFEDQGKSTDAYFSEDFTDKRAELLNRNNIAPKYELEPLNYSISIPYDKGEVERVSYDTQDKHITLHITPGTAEFDFDSVKYAIEGSSFDLILVVGARKLDWLGRIYNDNKDVFSSTKVIALNNLKGSQDFGDLKLADDKKQTLSEIVYDLISLLGGTQNEQIINALFEGVVAGADFQNKATISESTNNIIVNLLSAGADIKAALQNVYFAEEKVKELPAPVVSEPIEAPTVEKVETTEKLEQPELIKAEEPKKKAHQLKRGRIGIVKKSQKMLEEKEDDPDREPSLGFIKPPVIEKTAKIPLGAPIKTLNSLKPDDES